MTMGDVNSDLKNVVDLPENQVNEPIKLVFPKPPMESLLRISTRERHPSQNTSLVSLFCWQGEPGSYKETMSH